MQRFSTQYVFRDQRKAVVFATHNNEASMTQQSDAEETDINVILAKYGVQQFPQVTEKAEYGDFTTVSDYRTALDMVRDAQEKFMEVPARVREEFGNDPARFIEFAQDPKNLDKMRDWKLAPPPPPPPEPVARPQEIEYNDDGATPRFTSKATGYERQTANTNERTRADQSGSRSGGPSRESGASLREREGVRPYGAGESGRGPSGQ